MIGKNSLICEHGNEDGKCEYCTPDSKKYRIEPLKTYGESLNKNNDSHSHLMKTVFELSVTSK